MRRQVVAAITRASNIFAALGAAVALLLTSGPVSHAQLVPVPPGQAMPPVVTLPGSAVNGAGVISTQHLTFSPDATWDIGASGATRPRNGFLSGSAVLGGNVQAATVLATGTGGFALTVGAVMFVSPTNPTATTFCTSPTVPNANGTAAFEINVGTACATSVGTITLPAAAHAWAVTCHNVTAPATNIVEQTGGTTTTATVTNYVRTTGVAGNWTDSNVLRCHADAY